MEDPLPAPDKVVSLDLRRGKDECNLAEWPLTLLTDRVPDGMKSLEFCDTIRDPKTQKPVTRRLTVHASDKYGLPTPKDEEVILGLIQLSKAGEFSSRTVHFSRHQLLHLIGWPDTGQSYRRLGESLQRWVFVGLEYENAWWDHQAKSWVTESFHILERVALYESERRSRKTQQTALPFSSFTWNDVLFRSFHSGYLKQLDLRKYFELSTSTARRMFRFLDKRFYHGSRWEFDLRTFAFEHVGLSRDYHTGKIKEKLTPAIEELEARNYLEPLSPADRYVKVGRGEWKIIFVRKGSPRVSPQELDAQPSLGKELADRGVTAKTAAELVAAYPADQVARQIDVFDWRRDQPGEEELRNPGAWLKAAIEGDYAPPKGYEPKEVREQKRAAAEEARQQRASAQEKRKTAEKQREEAEAAARKIKQDHIDRYLAGLSSAERAALEDRAIASLDGTSREFLKKEGPLAEVSRRLAIEKEVLRAYPLG